MIADSSDIISKEEIPWVLIIYMNLQNSVNVYTTIYTAITSDFYTTILHYIFFIFILKVV